MARGLVDIAIFGSFRKQGGVPRRMANVIKVWAEYGYRIDLVSYRGGVCFYPEEIGQHIRFIDLGTHSKVATLLALWRYLRRRRPRVMLSTSHVANMVVSWLGYLPDTGARRFVSVPNTFGASRRRSGSRLRSKLSTVQRFYRHADGVIAISEGVRRDLVDTIGLRDVPVHRIFNGSVTHQNSVRAREPIEHPWLDGRSNIPVVLTVGRLAPQKDQATLLEAVTRIRRERDCRLIILGDGPLRQDLIAMARRLGIHDDFDLPGFVDNPYAWMARADCFVLCSLWEGFPNVLAEALGLGVPVVATDCPSGPADILADGRYGKLVPPSNPKALATAIGEVLDGQRPAFDVDEAVREFTAETAAARYLQVFGLADQRECA